MAEGEIHLRLAVAGQLRRGGERGLTPNGHAETVALDLKEMRDDVYLNSWTEASGATVTHVEDFVNATVYSDVTGDGTLDNLVGTITEVTCIIVADNAVTGSDQVERNTEIVLTAMRELFGEKDLTSYRTSPRLSQRSAVTPWCEPIYVTSRNERTTAMNDQNQQEVTIRDNPDKSRFDVFVEDTHAGFSLYKDFGEIQRIFYHTVVFDEFEGRGLASTLTRTALNTSAQAGYRIVAVCPYVKKWLSTHHDFDEAIDPVGREHLRALR